MITLLARPRSLVADTTVTLEEEEEHHLVVRRTAPDAAIELVDGEGARAEGRLALEGRRLLVRVLKVVQEPAPPATVLAVGAGDRDRFALLAEQLAPLGGTRLVPLETVHTASVATRLRPTHLERVRRRAREALKQCRAAWAPVIEDPCSLAEFLARAGAGRRWLAELTGKTAPSFGPTEPITIAIGPEAGFTAEEQAAFAAAGFEPVRLAPHRLRFETAALAALTTAWLARQRGGYG